MEVVQWRGRAEDQEASVLRAGSGSAQVLAPPRLRGITFQVRSWLKLPLKTGPFQL